MVHGLKMFVISDNNLGNLQVFSSSRIFWKRYPCRSSGTARLPLIETNPRRDMP